MTARPKPDGESRGRAASAKLAPRAMRTKMVTASGSSRLSCYNPCNSDVRVMLVGERSYCMDFGVFMVLIVVAVMLVFIGLAVNKNMKNRRARDASKEPPQ